VLASKKDSNGGVGHRRTKKVKWEELRRRGLELGHGIERRRSGASASATEVLQARFLRCQEEGGRQRCGVKGGDVEVGQPDNAKPMGLRD
jgi:hypothetical protein